MHLCRIGRIYGSSCQYEKSTGERDGRFTHWVAPYDTSAERYSLIYYSTWQEYERPVSAYFGKAEEEECEMRNSLDSRMLEPQVTRHQRNLPPLGRDS